MELSTGSTKLSHVLKNLRVHWDESQGGWNDKVRDEFEETHIRELEARVAAALGAIERLAQALAQARSECS